MTLKAYIVKLRIIFQIPRFYRRETVKKIILKEEIRSIFKDELGIFIETPEQEEQSLFYFNSKFTSAMGTYLFAILYCKYKLDLSEVISELKNEMTFSKIVNYVFYHKSK